MADKIVYDYQKMNNAVAQIRTIKDNYKNAGVTFNTNFTQNSASWQGESKDKLLQLINGDINTMLTKNIPEYLEALASLLEQNADQMAKADNQIAQSIPPQLTSG